MFFSEKIKSIKPTDRVLEIGPGGTPHERADEFLDLDPSIFKDENEAAHQRGLAPPLRTAKKIHYYDGKKFPFKDKEFDYVICSHVLEHVDNPDEFLKELFRIGKRGYIEYPTILYDYIYDIPVHPNFVYFNKDIDTLVWLKKTDTTLSHFEAVQRFFFESVARGHDSLILSLADPMMQGFEWSKPFKSRRAKSIQELVPPLSRIKKAVKQSLAPAEQINLSEDDVLKQMPLHKIKTEIKLRAKRRTKRMLVKVVPLQIRKSIYSYRTKGNL